MNIGILGSDSRATAIARMLRGAGHDVTLSDPFSDDRARRAADGLNGATASTPYDQVSHADVLVIATRWQDLDRTLNAMGPVSDTVIVDATRPAAAATKWSGAELLSRKLDNRHVVKAFTTAPEPGGTMSIASDDPNAKMLVAHLVESVGMTAVDAGPLSAAREIERTTEQQDPAA